LARRALFRCQMFVFYANSTLIIYHTLQESIYHAHYTCIRRFQRRRSLRRFQNYSQNIENK